MRGVTEDLIVAYTTNDGLALGELVRNGQLTPSELIEAAVVTIERLNPHLNAVIHRLYDMGRAAAATVDMTATFVGVPYLLKELERLGKARPLRVPPSI